MRSQQMARKAVLALVVGALALPSVGVAAHRARGTGVLDPGCPANALSAYLYCPEFPILFSLDAQTLGTRAKGLFTTRWLVPGRSSTTFRGRVWCMNVVGNAAVVGGRLIAPGILTGLPFVEFVVDNGVTGDLVSDLGIFPFDDPDLVFLPVDFPVTCPTPGLLASIYGYLPVHTGNVVVR